MEWLASLDAPTGDELRATVVPKDSDVSGSSYARGDSMVRVTGDPAFVEQFAGFPTPFLEFESDDTWLEISLKQPKTGIQVTELKLRTIYLSHRTRMSTPSNG